LLAGLPKPADLGTLQLNEKPDVGSAMKDSVSHFWMRCGSGIQERAQQTRIPESRLARPGSLTGKCDDKGQLNHEALICNHSMRAPVPWNGRGIRGRPKS
jgi:hypothetical protein